MVRLSCSGTGGGIYAKLANAVARHNCAHPIIQWAAMVGNGDVMGIVGEIAQNVLGAPNAQSWRNSCRIN